jgi:hypothetical protein
MPNYVPTDWADGVTPVDEAHLDKIEAGIVAAVPRDGVMASGLELLRNSFAVGDAFAGFTLGAEGAMYFGAGGASAWDARIYRSSPYTLHLGSVLEIEQHLTIGTVANAYLALKNDANAIYFGAASDTNLYRHASGALVTDNPFYASLGAQQVGVGLVGPGGTAGLLFSNLQDTNLYRSAAGTLRTDGQLDIGGGSTIASHVVIDASNTGTRLWFGTAYDTSIRKTAAAQLSSDAQIVSEAANGGFVFRPVAAGGLALLAALRDDPQPRFYIDYGGFHRWGDGAVAPDISLYRSSANALAITGNLTVEKAVAGGTALPSNNFAFYTGFSEGAGIAFLIRNQGRLEWGDGVGGALDTILYRSGAGQLSLQGTLMVSGAIHSGANYNTFLFCSGVVQVVSPADNWAYIASFNGDAQQRLLIYNSGKITWGDGVAGPDTNLYRAGPGALKTDGDLQVVGKIYAFNDLVAGNGTAGEIWLAGNAGSPAIYFHNSHDTYIYRPTPQNLQTNARFRAAGGFEFGDGTVQTTAAGTRTRQYPLKLTNPRSMSEAGNAFWTVASMNNFDLAHWEFVKDVQGRVTGQILIPKSVAAVPNGKIVLILCTPGVAGVTRFSLMAQRTAFAGGWMQLAFDPVAAQDLAVPSTGFQFIKATFALPWGVQADHLLVVEIVHEGAHANDTLASNTWLVEAYLEVEA